MKLELCVENLHGARLAARLGYDSVEVNQALVLGGLTPSLGLVRKLNNLDIKKNIMLRPRPAGFSYTREEYETMLSDLDLFLQEDLDGIVFGILTDDFQVDKKRSKILVDKIHKKGKRAIFHRAFDNCRDPFKAIEDLIDLGFDGLLTSGQAEKAIDGLDILKTLNESYGQSIQIVAASGINASNALEIIDKTGIGYLHASSSSFREDLTTDGNISFSFGRGLSYQVNDDKKAKALVDTVKQLGD